MTKDLVLFPSEEGGITKKDRLFVPSVTVMLHLITVTHFMKNNDCHKAKLREALIRTADRRLSQCDGN